jgi:hypothetical protein
MHVLAITTNSGIEAINCMGWYNGNNVCTPPKDLISIYYNNVLTPLLFESNNRIHCQ